MPQLAVHTRRHLDGFPPSAILNNAAEDVLHVRYKMQTFIPEAPFLSEAYSQSCQAIKAQHKLAPHTHHSGQVQPWGGEREDPATGTR